jgi:hypothetical protein
VEPCDVANTCISEAAVRQAVGDVGDGKVAVLVSLEVERASREEASYILPRGDRDGKMSEHISRCPSFCCGEGEV